MYFLINIYNICAAFLRGRKEICIFQLISTRYVLLSEGVGQAGRVAATKNCRMFFDLTGFFSVCLCRYFSLGTESRSSSFCNF